ncbi:TPA: helix-turn-helix domain-containing protein [Enterobacter asburiae]
MMALIGEKITELRKKSNLSQEELSFLCGWNGTWKLKKYENNLKEMNIEDAISMAYFLGVPPALLLSGTIGNDEYIKYKGVTVPVVGEMTASGVTVSDYVLTSERAFCKK